MQTANLSVQATVEKKLIATGMAITFFAQQLGGAIFVSVGQTILSTVLVSKLSDIPGLNAEQIVKTGATELHSVVPDKYFGQVLQAYNYAITRIFIASIAITAMHLLSSAGVEWKTIKKPEAAKPQQDAEKQAISE
ncbi:hypothetical protein K4F52_006321 [Lecanicillium sp. MT-2017a]|nr:hypothetical protein K4F52_006321 [Lecanicillium sp. MT-2017a]